MKMNHIAQYRNGIHHQIHPNHCPPIQHFARFPAPNITTLPDSVMIPQIVSEGTIQYHNAPLQPFFATSENRAPGDIGVKVSSTLQRKPMMSVRNIQPVPSPITSTPSCTNRQDAPRAPDICNDNSYKPATTSPSAVDNRQFIQHCNQGVKNCIQCYNTVKGITPSGTVIKVMVDAATMTDQEEMDQTASWSGSTTQPVNTKVTEYLSSLRQFLKVDQKLTNTTENKKRLGDVRIVTSPDGSRLYCCPECHMAYPDKNLLEPHLASHKIERRFICNVCGAGLKRKEHLDRHQLSHSEERPYSCSVCPKTFKRNEHLSRHSVIHSGHKAQMERAFVCGTCGLGHVRKEHLDRHQLSHTDARPYSCAICPKTFKRNEHLSRHLAVHSGHKSQVCTECGKGFYRKDHLRKHAESHHAKRLKLGATLS